MRKIVYYVAVSVDGFIAGPEDNIEGFAGEGSGVQQYLDDLKTFDTVIMGRRTYEFGYKFGLQPGQSPYPHMKNYIFSKTLQLDKAAENVVVCLPDISIIKKLKTQAGTDIYLCGGGEFAGWLLDNGLIDILKIKLNPLVLGNGISLFGSSGRKVQLEFLKQVQYDLGLQIMTYSINYH
jgi:dihydrofolate reductase